MLATTQSVARHTAIVSTALRGPALSQTSNTTLKATPVQKQAIAVVLASCFFVLVVEIHTMTYTIRVTFAVRMFPPPADAGLA